jgi:hypothetical protein
MKRQREEIRLMEDALKEMQKSWEEKLKESEEKAKKMRGSIHIDFNKPHITNLNEDPLVFSFGIINILIFS